MVVDGEPYESCFQEVDGTCEPCGVPRVDANGAASCSGQSLILILFVFVLMTCIVFQYALHGVQLIGLTSLANGAAQVKAFFLS